MRVLRALASGVASAFSLAPGRSIATFRREPGWVAGRVGGACLVLDWSGTTRTPVRLTVEDDGGFPRISFDAAPDGFVFRVADASGDDVALVEATFARGPRKVFSK